ncbi:acyl-CoA dehydrogenase family protein [Nocardia vaccinii]|uniref:acyl-CoA dehydrogenase family protein n=1 Tax=Nocardia vaccinii TaxID=1822 RepID=UPI000829D703|nr:acyl-CoA dehydrogenase family protein [Nocardia vaccinii]
MRDLTDRVGLAADPLAESTERADLRAAVRDVIAVHSPPDRVLELDDAEDFDDNLHSALAKIGAMAIGAREEDGGIGDIRDQMTVVEELGSGPTSMAVNMIVHYMGVHILSSQGSAEQRREWLEPLLAGQAKFSFALTEPSAGTDIASGMRARATKTESGWVLNGQKMWISGAERADFFVVLARSADLGRSTVDGITMFLVPAKTPGITVRRVRTVAVHGLGTCEVFLDNVELSESAVIGQPDRGFRLVMETLNRERLNSSSGAIGAARGALDYIVGYASERVAFGKSLGSFQSVQHRLVDGALAIESGRSLMLRAAAVEAAGGRADLLSSMAKIACTEAAVKVTQDAMETMGGAGLSRETPVQRWFRDVRLWVFAPLANDMVRNYLGERFLELPRSF